MADERIDRLLGRVLRTFGEAEPDIAVQRVRAIVGMARFPEGSTDAELAKQALAALKKGQVPSPVQQAGLEIMLRMMRPAPVFRGGQLEGFATEEFSKMFPDWAQFQAGIVPFARSVGRVELRNGLGQGTGFLVNEETLVTNRHVLDAISNGTRRLQRGQAQVSFRKEYRTEDEAPVAITGVKAFHPSQDIALLKVDAVALSATRRPLAIAGAAPARGEPVVALGFPFDDPQRNPAFIGTIFGDKFGVKRAAPGDAVDLIPQDSLWEHDCSTLGGNSGSPVVSMRTAEVFGLHFGGTFLWRNEALDAPAIAGFIRANG